MPKIKKGTAAKADTKKPASVKTVVTEDGKITETINTYKEVPGVVLEETPKAEDFVAQEKPMSGEAEAINPDHLTTTTDELPLKDEMILSKEELPEDKVVFDKEASPYHEDVETIEAEEPTPIVARNEEWVGDPALLRKVKGQRDTLNGTLYLGVRK